MTLAKNMQSQWAIIKEKLGKNIKLFSKKGLYFIDKNPFKSFIFLLFSLIVFIVIGNILRQSPQEVPTKVEELKNVKVFTIGRAPRLLLPAKVEKSGVAKIVSLSGGIVQEVYKYPGETVSINQNLFYVSSNYQGANLAGVGRQIAQKNYNFIKDTYDSQKSIISTNRQIAQKSESQAQQLLDIQGETISGTQALINLNNEVLSSIQAQITQLESMNVNGSSDSAILQLQLTQAQVQAGLNQAQAQLNSLEYQGDADNEPSQLATLQRDVTLKSLEIQEKTLDLNRDIARLNLRIAQIQESFAYPSTPFSGVLERVNVQKGEYVTPGTVLATVVSDKQFVKVIVLTSQHIAQNVSKIEPTKIYFNEKSIELYPQYISTEATDGNLFSITYVLATEFATSLTDNENIEVELPIGTASTNGYFPYIPLDSIFQTKDDSFIFIVKKQKNSKIAESQKVTLGSIYGEYVEVKEGYKDGMEIIIDRNIIAGDKITTNLK